MIDKRIFYCWFGNGEMSELDKKCMASWEKVCPDYEIVRIDETNYDYKANDYAYENYEHGNWSAVSNAARLEFLKHNNGFYLDTDVQLVKSLNIIRELDGGIMTEFESGQPDSGVLACGDTFPWLYDVAYEELKPGTILHKNFIRNMYQKYDVHGQQFTTYEDKFTILGEEYFPTVRTGLMTENTIGVHHFENTWAGGYLSVTDKFYPFPHVNVFMFGRETNHDDAATVNLTVKNIKKKWSDGDMIGKCNYFFNPKVIKLVCRDFEAERIDYDRFLPQYNLVTPSGLIVTYTGDSNN